MAQGVSDGNTNIELAQDASMCDGCLVDISSDCSDADYPIDFIHLTGSLRGHVDHVQSV